MPEDYRAGLTAHARTTANANRTVPGHEPGTKERPPTRRTTSRKKPGNAGDGGRSCAPADPPSARTRRATPRDEEDEKPHGRRSAPRPKRKRQMNEREEQPHARSTHAQENHERREAQRRKQERKPPTRGTRSPAKGRAN